MTLRRPVRHRDRGRDPERLTQTRIRDLPSVAAGVVTAMLMALALIAGCADSGSITRSGNATSTSTSSTDRSSTTGGPQSAPPSPGAADAGDDRTPGNGNGGYDVDHYDIELTVTSDRARIAGTTTVTATATQPLSRFNLDLAGMEVEAVTVDEAAATFRREGNELVITPDQPIDDGVEFDVAVRYSGAPTAIAEPSAPLAVGWLNSASGSYIAAEPIGAKTIYPSNDHPSDKATFRFEITAPSADTVATNGRLIERVPAGATTTWTYEVDEPMATYLTQIAVGAYTVQERPGPNGVALRDVVRSDLADSADEQLAVTDEQLEFFASKFGEYPFDTYGVLVADSPPSFAMETQTLTLMPAEWFGDDASMSDATRSEILAHELAHHWFGNSVTLGSWSDIWLNEGFATYAEWLWADHAGSRSLDEAVSEALAAAPDYRAEFGQVAAPSAADLFSPNVYDGAAIVLHALRRTVGDDTFFTILRDWATEFRGTSVASADFEGFAATKSGRDLSEFFDAWLRSTDVPAMPN